MISVISGAGWRWELRKTSDNSIVASGQNDTSLSKDYQDVYVYPGEYYLLARPYTEGGYIKLYGNFSDDFSDFFESIFGGGFSGAGAGSRRTRSFRGEDLQAVMDVNLEEVLKGTQRIVNLNGQSIKLKIKPGVRNDQVLRMKGKGSPGRNGGESGDLLITIRVLNHPVFTVKGNDLYTDLYVEVLTAILGGKVTLNTLDKPVSITIPEGTDSGKTLRLKGAGIPEYGSIDKRGELYVRILVRVPKSLSQKEKELYMELKRIKDSGLVNS